MPRSTRPGPTSSCGSSCTSASPLTRRTGWWCRWCATRIARTSTSSRGSSGSCRRRCAPGSSRREIGRAVASRSRAGAASAARLSRRSSTRRRSRFSACRARRCSRCIRAALSCRASCCRCRSRTIIASSTGRWRCASRPISPRLSATRGDCSRRCCEPRGSHDPRYRQFHRRVRGRRAREAGRRHRPRFAPGHARDRQGLDGRAPDRPGHARPGGYTAAFRAADLGLKVTLVERWQELGGVCLNVGCIPSKALLHAAKVIEDAEEMGARGIAFGAPQLDLQRLRAWKSSVVAKLTGGLKVLVKQRKVDVVRGTGRFVGPNVLEVMGTSGSQRIHFDQCIIAAGSEPVRLAGLPDDPRILDSTDALELPSFSGGLLVVGGGIIGLEMACVFDALGVRVSVVELTPQLMPGCDPDLVRPLERRIRSRYEQILLGTRVAGIERDPGGLRVSFTGDNAPSPQIFGRVLVAVGRTPNGHTLGAELAGVKVSERGFIPVDRQMRTNVPHIFAIGDIAAPPLLAHKAMHEGKVASEVAPGRKGAADWPVIPSAAYTDPAIAWGGLTERDARAN